jgi:splicing factor U2AF subunit
MDRDEQRPPRAPWGPRAGSGGGFRSKRDFNNNGHSRYGNGGRSRRATSRERGGGSGGFYRERDRRDIERERERHDREREERRRYRDRSLERDRGRPRVGRSISPPRGPRSMMERENIEANAVPIDERKRKRSLWDVTPKGFENVPTELAKHCGLFPLPGHADIVDMSKLEGYLAPDAEIPDGSGQGFRNGSSGNSRALIATQLDALKASTSRTARRIVVSGIDPARTKREDVGRFFDQLLRSINTDAEFTAADSKAVWFTYPTTEPSTVYLELQTAEMAAIAVAMNGTLKIDGKLLTIRRPAGFVAPEKKEEDVPSLADQVVISNLLPFLSETQVRELLASFGELKNFKLIKDRNTQECKGIALAEFKDSSLVPIVCEGLNNMDLGGQAIKVQRACEGGFHQSPAMAFTPLSSMAALANENPIQDNPRVIQILNAVTPEQMADDYEYGNVKKSIKGQCQQYGTVLDVKIPRPAPGTVGRITTTSTIQNPGVGKVFVKFESADASRKALNELGGVKFDDRTIVTAFYPEDNFDLSIF